MSKQVTLSILVIGLLMASFAVADVPKLINYQGFLNDSEGNPVANGDHNLDPESQYLCHSSINAPEMANIYSGNVTTDENGEAIVAFPDYFEALNGDFRYQLTVLGDFAQAIISEEINKNQFAIKTNKPYIRVSWQVAGTRKDPCAEANHTKVEIYKSGKDKGLYIHPEVFGLSPEMQINFEQNEAALEAAERSE